MEKAIAMEQKNMITEGELSFLQPGWARSGKQLAVSALRRTYPQASQWMSGPQQKEPLSVSLKPKLVLLSG